MTVYLIFMLATILFPISQEEESPTWSAYVGKMFTAASTYLPTQVSDMMHQDRAFATVRLNMFGLKNICALATWGTEHIYVREQWHVMTCMYLCRIQKLPRLLVASSDGFLYIYNVDPQDGGECVLVQKHRLVSHWRYQYVQKYLKLTATVNSNDPKKVNLCAGVFLDSSLLYRWWVFAPFSAGCLTPARSRRNTVRRTNQNLSLPNQSANLMLLLWRSHQLHPPLPRFWVQ